MSKDNIGIEASSETQKHIAFFVIALIQGGVGRNMLNLADFFVEKGYRVDLLVVRQEGEYLTQIPRGVQLFALGGGKVAFSVTRLARYLRRRQPDFLVSAVTRANLAAIWARSLARVNTRLVVTERTALSVDVPASQRRRDRLLPRLVKHFYPKADAVVAVSKGVADDLSSLTGLNRSMIKVLYNPVISARFADMQQPAPEHPWFSDNGPPIVLAIGRLTAQKDFPTLLRAFAQLKKSMPARLMILGEGEKRAELESLGRELAIGNDIALPGFVDNPPSYLCRAALFVLSSRWEGLPTVLIEAIACGTPVVATDCPSGPAEILEEGALGPLIPVGDVNTLSEAMAAVLRSPPESDRLRTRSYAFSVQNCAVAYERLLSNL